ncbi:MAG: STT3 domain-containing protein [Candidatus Hermodarchaeota archaeon]
MSRIYSSLKKLRDRARASISIKQFNILFFLALFFVIFLAIYIRLSPLASDNSLIKAFDPWIQYYNANYLSTHSIFDYFHWHDFKSWFPEGYNRANLRPGLTFTVVAIYQFINSIGIPVSLYDVCFYFPAFMGGASVFAIYLVGKEALDRRCGLIAAFFLAFNPGFMQRTTAGFFDNETIGVFATLMTFYFFIKTVRTGKIVNSFLGGLFLGYLSLSWGGFNFTYMILPLVCGIIILLKKYTPNLLIAYVGTEGIGLLIYALSIKFPFGTFLTTLELGGIFYFSIFLLVFHLLYTHRDSISRFYNGLINFIKWGLIPGVLVLAGIIWVAPDLIPFGFGARLTSVLSPLLRESISIVASVAEHMPSSWSVFYYNTLIPLMLLPLGLFFLFKRGNVADILLLTFLILIFYFTGSMIRIILLFAPAACLVGAYGLANILKIFGSFYGEQRTGISRKRKRQVKRTVGKTEIGAVYFIVGVMCIAQVMHASNIAVTQLSQSQIAPGGQIHDWEESLTWMKDNLPGTTVVVSWWDYGYWLTPIGNMTTVNDNGTVNETRIGLTGMALMQTNEIYSAKIFKRLKADYVLVYFGMLYSNLGGDEGKWPWMVRICNDNYQTYKKWGLEEDNWGPNSVFVESEYFNDTLQKPNPKWFQSQLVKLMFYGLPTSSPDDPQNLRSFTEYYQAAINSRQDAQGNTYATNIPQNGQYDFDVFKKAYISANGLVRLFKIDYTALESSFRILNPEVFDSGYSTFKLKNTGTKALTITSVKINGQSYSFKLGKGVNTNQLNVDDEDLVWVDYKSGGKTFNTNDVVNIQVEAESVGIDNSPYTFSNYTSNLFVKEAIKGDIRISKQDSQIVHVSNDFSEIYLKVENVGLRTVILKDFYVNTRNNTLDDVTYLSGSSILEAGKSASVKINFIDYSNYQNFTKYFKIGVITPNDITDELLLASNYENFKISMLPDTRIQSPEALILSQTDFRKHIPINLDQTYAYNYDNGTTVVNLVVRNTGDIIIGLDSIYFRNTGDWVSALDFGTVFLNPGHETSVPVKVPSAVGEININDELGIIVTAIFDNETRAADVGYVHTIVDRPDIQIIETVEDRIGTYIAANETGKVLIKNTGDETITLDKIFLNTTTELDFASDVVFEYGDITLGLQECALVSFNVTGLMLNASNVLNVKVTTNTSAEFDLDLTVTVDSRLYKIKIDDPGTIASNTGNVVIYVKNTGLLNVTLDAVYINNTFISLSEFIITSYTIGPSNPIQLTIAMINLEAIIGAVDVGDKLEILVRTEEGAENVHIETVKT